MTREEEHALDVRLLVRALRRVKKHMAKLNAETPVDTRSRASFKALAARWDQMRVSLEKDLTQLRAEVTK